MFELNNEEIKRKIVGQDANIEEVFKYLGELIRNEGKPNPGPGVGYRSSSEED